MTGKLILVFVVSYLAGSIPTGYWLAKALRGIDLCQHGSGNLGATNVFRVLGKGPGALTLSIDILKGTLPVLWAKQLFPDLPAVPIAAGLLAIVGHTTSIFVHFRGGKGVATSAGVFAALLPLPFLAATAVFMIALVCTRIVSISSIVGAITLAIGSFFFSSSVLLSYTATAVAGFVIWKHRSNIKRFIKGKEPRIGQKLS